MNSWVIWIGIMFVVLFIMYLLANYSVIRNPMVKKKVKHTTSKHTTSNDNTSSESSSYDQTSSDQTSPIIYNYDKSDDCEKSISYDDLMVEERKMLKESGILDIVNENTDLTPDIPSILNDDEYRPDGFYRGNGRTSKGEVECKAAAERIYGVPFHTIRPHWLGGLEIDCYAEIDGMKLGIEYNGQQHYKYTPFFHRNGPSDLAAQIIRDHRTLDLCEQNGVHLIYVPYNVKLNRIENYIKYSDPSRVEQRSRLAKLN